MEGYCFACSVRFVTLSDDERLCTACRPPITWGDLGRPDPPDYPDDGCHVMSPIKILVDTREQLAYTFDGLKTDAKRGRRKLFVPISVQTIPAGDYTIDGMVGKVVVERKTFADFCQSFGRNRQCELRKVESIAKCLVAWYVLEFPITNLIGPPPEYSSVNMRSLLGTVRALMVRYPNVGWVFAVDRRGGEVWTYRLLEKVHEEWIIKPTKRMNKSSPGVVAADGKVSP
jgi:hypothetical protein